MITYKPIEKKEDLVIIQDLANKTWYATYSDSHSRDQLDYMIEMMYATDILTKELKEGILFHVAYDQGNPIGFISVGMYDKALKNAKLHKLYLCFDYHGKGVGTDMLAHAKEMSRSLGATTMRLSVSKFNERAQKFYKKQGLYQIDEFILDIGRGFVMNDFVLQCDLI